MTEIYTGQDVIQCTAWDLCSTFYSLWATDSEYKIRIKGGRVFYDHACNSANGRVRIGRLHLTPPSDPTNWLSGIVEVKRYIDAETPCELVRRELCD